MKEKQERQVGIVPENEYKKWVAKQKVQTLLQKIKGEDAEDLPTSKKSFAKNLHEDWESQYGNISGSSIEDTPISFSDISEQDVRDRNISGSVIEDPPTPYDPEVEFEDYKRVTKTNKDVHYEPQFTKREDGKEMGWKDFQSQVDSHPTRPIVKGDLFKDGYRIVEDFLTKEECQAILDGVTKDDRPIMKRINYEMGMNWGDEYDPQEAKHDRLSDLFRNGLTPTGICTGRRIQEFYLVASPHHPAEVYPSEEEVKANPDKYESFSLPILKLYEKLEAYLASDYGVEPNDYSWNANFQFYFPGSFISFHNDGVVEGRLGVVLICLNEKIKNSYDWLEHTGYTEETIKHQDPGAIAARWYKMNESYEGGDLILYPEGESDEKKRKEVPIKIESKPGKMIILDFTKNNIYHELTELENWSRISFVGFFFQKGKESPDLTQNTY